MEADMKRLSGEDLRDWGIFRCWSSRYAASSARGQSSRRSSRAGNDFRGVGAEFHQRKDVEDQDGRNERA